MYQILKLVAIFLQIYLMYVCMFIDYATMHKKYDTTCVITYKIIIYEKQSKHMDTAGSVCLSFKEKIHRMLKKVTVS